MSIKIVSGEGEQGSVEFYDGQLTKRALLRRLREERCDGDRWAYVMVDGQQVEDDEIDAVLRTTKVS